MSEYQQKVLMRAIRALQTHHSNTVGSTGSAVPVYEIVTAIRLAVSMAQGRQEEIDALKAVVDDYRNRLDAALAEGATLRRERSEYQDRATNAVEAGMEADRRRMARTESHPRRGGGGRMTDCARCPRVRRKNALIRKMADALTRYLPLIMSKETGDAISQLVEEAKKEAAK